jgi:type IV secretory pathway VirB4 component
MNVALGTYLKNTPAERELSVPVLDLVSHMAMIGATGMGKTTLIQSLSQQLSAFAFIDGEGDAALRIGDSLDCLYFRASDYDHPFGINPIQNVHPDKRDELCAEIVEMFADRWGLGPQTPRVIEYLNASIRLLLDNQNTTLVELPLVITDDAFRARMLSKCKHKQTQEFWHDFERRRSEDKKFKGNDTASTLNKVRALSRSLPLRLILGQSTATINFRQIMDKGQRVIFDLSGIGEEPMQLLGAIIISQFANAGYSRRNIKEEDRKPYFLIIDEFSDFASATMPKILKKSRKRRLGALLAHQSVSQIEDTAIIDAIYENVGAIVCFGVGSISGKRLSLELSVSSSALQNLNRGQAYARVQHEGRKLQALYIDIENPPMETGHLDRNITQTRRRHTRNRKDIEYQLDWWSRVKWMQEKRDRHAADEFAKAAKKLQDVGITDLPVDGWG